jgi:hypothetical protein
MIGLCIAWLILSQQPVPLEAAPRAAATRDESKKALENHKKATPRIPMPPAPDANVGGLSRVNNGRFRAYYIAEELRETPSVTGRTATTGGTTAPRPADPAFSLDNTFKVKLFWISSRANDCFY